ncbi:MAG: CRISPR-associated endonuclease Cas2 [gamma proteobacterium endosymbiont of Lamellibrachia anaximandri]|nr:CRISPR-associated endonuclease Cas2 [gamma proteobacterium endosymbiont of Lamellibrachia anaximandri]MBL3535496.1 CRISPR-associated endonuclease Cas2 [gamma proteobacterium endosymbiont of Lamellibrachia anaximandri]
MLWVISYDIVEDRRRRRVSRIMEGKGMRVQYSVFECHLDAASRKALVRELTREIDPDEDSIRWYPQCNYCLPHAKNLGLGIEVGEGRDYLLV